MAISSNLNLLDRSIRGVIGICVTAFALFNGDLIGDVFIEILLGIFGLLNLISLFSGCVRCTSWQALTLANTE